MRTASVPQEDYLSASKKCDVVMKGGITSGIVYPRAICRLAREYRFHSIGGTSAGAIAAALTAGAEYRRGQGESVFDQLARIPEWLGAKSPGSRDSNLFNLFQPQVGMKGLFQIATALLIKSWSRRLIQLASALWLDLILGLLPGVLIIFLTWPAYPVLGSILGVLVALAGALIGSAVGIVIRASRLARYQYGLCTGYAAPQHNRPDALTEWLNNQINSLANRPPNRPLTFGDLRRAGINLEVITTCLTFGRPYTLPFRTGEFYFSPLEMRQFFPPEVVDWMEECASALSTYGEPVDTSGLKPLPAADDLPVIVATRLSLSFPILFCAVPLYAIDWTRRRRCPKEAAPPVRVPGDALSHDEPRRPEPVWFSDGGISSNFPLHLFDAALPRWPTFGLNLQKLRPDRQTREDRVWMPRTNRSGIAHHWTRLNREGGTGASARFLATILDAARNWNDHLQTMVPGYRDRIAHIYLDKDEGGLNLNMTSSDIDGIAAYGERAADKLIDHFTHGTDDGRPTPMTWDNHRWIRYRSTMAVIETFLSSLRNTLEHPEPDDRSYFELIDRPLKTPPTSYPLTSTQQVYAGAITAGLNALGRELGAGELSEGAPRPKPALRVRPQF